MELNKKEIKNIWIECRALAWVIIPYNFIQSVGFGPRQN